MLINRDLTEWAKHGVLLLNTSLTVRAHEVDLPYLHSTASHLSYRRPCFLAQSSCAWYKADIKAGSHAGKGWESFTAAILKTITSRHIASGETTPEKGVVLMAWGKHAQNMVTGVDKVYLLFFFPSLPRPDDYRQERKRKKKADFPENQSCSLFRPPVSFRSYERVLWEWAFQSGQYVVGREIWPKKRGRLGFAWCSGLIC